MRNVKIRSSSFIKGIVLFFFNLSIFLNHFLPISLSLFQSLSRPLFHSLCISLPLFFVPISLYCSLTMYILLLDKLFLILSSSVLLYISLPPSIPPCYTFTHTIHHSLPSSTSYLSRSHNHSSPFCPSFLVEVSYMYRSQVSGHFPVPYIDG